MENTINIRRVNIGTCFNAFSRDLLLNVQAFEIGKLQGKNLLRTNKGDEEFQLIASSDNDSAYQSEFFGSNTKAEFGFFKTKVGAGFSMETSSSHMKDSTAISCKLSNQKVRQNIELLNMNHYAETDYYSCLMPDVQRAYKDLVEEINLKKKRLKYITFVQTFGTGFVSRLFLESGSIAKIVIESNSESNSESEKYGITGGVSFKGAGVSNATDFGDTLMKGNIEGTLAVFATTAPHDSPTKEWIQQVTNTFVGKGVDFLTKSSSFADLPIVSYSDLPPIIKEPVEDKKPPESTKAKELEDDLKIRIMKLEDPSIDETPPDWDEWIAERKEKQKNETDLNAVIEEVLNIENEPTVSASKNNFATTSKVKNLFKPNFKYSNVSSTNSDYIRGFAPMDFVYTPWSAIFPEFSNISAIFGNDINVSKILIFQMSRIQFSQFLQFSKLALNDIKDVKKTIITDSSEYDECLQDYNKHLMKSIECMDQESYTDDDYAKDIAGFSANLETKKFTLVNYELFFEYYKYVINCPFGMILHGYKKERNSDNTFSYVTDKDTVITKIREVDGQLKPTFEKIRDKHTQYKKALRIYVLPSYDEYKGIIFDLCYYDTAKKKFAQLKTLRIDDEVFYKSRISEIDLLKTRDKFPYKFIFDNKLSLEPTHVSFDDVDNKDLEILSPYPMFENFPFDLAGNYSYLK
ncbi:hypothetical protein KORDIASMS9_03759 [Kordia sp. SMS9]|uniref:hypothetical protein n=1 Tax=Kordia sp. SMS9 TaxID=2282170 RepID=UPI000E0D1575|nr:hypothetical protein [Kordia sp. SMS9]AXG71502.1 hypothetical protein KORDIASMS9_03759 [Kordia sp. SMS9]